VPHAAARQVKHHVDPLQDPGQQRRIAQIAADNVECALSGAKRQVFLAACRKVVNDSHRAVRKRVDEMGADKSGPTRDENCSPVEVQRDPRIRSEHEARATSLQILFIHHICRGWHLNSPSMAFLRTT